jgi:ubiquinone/menaquinone biosynthesis C-methylase UbiE
MDATSAAYDQVAKAYHETVDPDGAGLRDPVFEELLGDVHDQNVLTIGCGQGRDARLLADLGATVTGVDSSERLLTYARQLEQDGPRGIRYVSGSAHDLAPFDDESFDGVVCYMALIDIPDLESTIAAIARVLRPGGWFAFSIVHPCHQPHLENIPGYFIEGRYRRAVRVVDWLPHHGYHRMLSTYVTQLANADLSIVRMIERPDEAAALETVPRLLYLRCHKSAL